MSKFVSKGNELLDRVRSQLGLFEGREYDSVWGNDYFAPDEVTNQFPDTLLDVQTLFFCDSPQLPLYYQAIKLNERVDWVLNQGGERFSYNDFKNLEKLLLKYLEYRAFLEAKD